ncbi:hypothetical protein [Methyloceanibacter sp.]|uniref:hypothetical protein n=1 Tax=Methyloceanibacter sp. TaxID=1965321 RepID=UPI002D504489|nr:hypothetical protein [Methyloceanibacter sp.]HZP10578.1 hypothetical protein [Methyloceanibacter sp.]
MTQSGPDTPDSEPLEAPHWPLVVWAARCSVYLLAQGGILLLSYAYYGFGTDPDHFAIGFRLDPLLAAVHFVWGLAGTFIGFYRPRYATAYALAFAVFYTALASLGSLTPYHFGMRLGHNINVFHWCVALFAWAVGLYALWHKRSAAC